MPFFHFSKENYHKRKSHNSIIVKCESCDFETKTIKELKIHKQEAHAY